MEKIVANLFNTGNKYTQVIILILILIHLVGGLYLIFNPTEVNPLFIRVLGVTWVLGGVVITIQWFNLCATKWSKEMDEKDWE